MANPQKIRRYSPRAYVPGSAPLNVAQAIQARGRNVPAPTKPPARPPVARPPVAPPAPAGPPPLTPEQQAAATVQAQLSPLVAMLNQQAQQRLTTGQNAITGYTSSLAHDLAGIPFGAPYAGAEQKQAAVDSSLQQALAGGGSKLAADLSTRLAGIQDPSVAAAAGQIAQQGTAAGNTQLAQGGASLGALIANEAAAKDYGQKLPGIAGLAGLQDVRGLAGQVNADTGRQIADLQGQVPGLTNAALDRILRGQQATADAKAAAAKEKAAAQEKAARINPTLSAAMGVAVNDYGQAITGKGGKPVPYTPYSKPGSAASPKVFGSATGGYYKIDPVTGKVQQVVGGTGPKAAAPRVIKGADGATWAYDGTTGQLTPLLPGKTTTPTPTYTPSQVQHLKSLAADTAAEAWHGISKADPTTGQVTWLSPPKHYQQAMADLLQHGVPLAIAQSALNRYWTKPGSDADIAARQKGNTVWFQSAGGRPVAPFQQRTGKGSAVAEPTAYQTQKQGAVVALAKEALGTPYVWGGESKSGFDCSGLIQYVWAKQGVQVPRTTYDQWSAGRPVGKSQLEPGDAVFFKGSDSRTVGGRVLPGHIGMYVGDGKFIEAPRTGLTVRVSTLAGRGDYMGARRFV